MYMGIKRQLDSLGNHAALLVRSGAPSLPLERESHALQVKCQIRSSTRKTFEIRAASRPYVSAFITQWEHDPDPLDGQSW